MRRRQPMRRQTPGIATGGGMQYVLCPKCGDPVAGKLTAQLTCVHCKERFRLDESQVRTSVVSYDPSTKRWKIN
jgi:hypothetical protein